MSDLPSSPRIPFSPFAPGGPGGPCDPLLPGAPGAPTHTHVHAYTQNYCEDFRFCFQSKKTISTLYQWTNIVCSKAKAIKHEYGQGGVEHQSLAFVSHN